MSIHTLSSTLMYQNPWLSVREDQIERGDGSRGIYSVVDIPDFALVIPADREGFHLVEQYRYPIQSRSWEFPSGSFPPGVTGTPEEMAAAELAEETGFTAGQLTKLGYLHCDNGISGLGVHIYLATELVAGEPNREIAEQDMRQRWFSRGDVDRMFRDGVITDAPSAAAYLLLSLQSARVGGVDTIHP